MSSLALYPTVWYKVAQGITLIYIRQQMTSKSNGYCKMSYQTACLRPHTSMVEVFAS